MKVAQFDVLFSAFNLHSRQSQHMQYLFQILLQLPASARMAQSSQCFGFYLTNPLSSHVELSSHLLQGAAAPVFKAKSKLKHPLLAGGKCGQHLAYLLWVSLTFRMVELSLF